MKKIIKEWSTTVELNNREAIEICKFGLGKKCCAFLVSEEYRFECWKRNYPDNVAIIEKTKDRTMIAKGRGEWKGCPWEEKAN